MPGVSTYELSRFAETSASLFCSYSSKMEVQRPTKANKNLKDKIHVAIVSQPPQPAPPPHCVLKTGTAEFGKLESFLYSYSAWIIYADDLILNYQPFEA